MHTHITRPQVSGEDLTPYRAASKAILSVLQRFGPAERLGMDEVWVDATQARARMCTPAAACTRALAPLCCAPVP